MRPTRASGSGRWSAAFTRASRDTFTGRLTEPMLDAVFSRARELVSG